MSYSLKTNNSINNYHKLTIQEILTNYSLYIGHFIIQWVKKNNGFKSRSFYGESFSLALLSRHKILNSKTKNILFKALDAKDKLDPEYHWEFNNYALLDYFNFSNDEHVKKIIEPLRFKNTNCTNWTLLRSCCRLKAGKDIQIALKESQHTLCLYQKPSGLILDEKRVKSFQYHCFSAAMTLEIYTLTKKKVFKDCFLKAVNFIRHFICDSGETLYIGRGQNQSFGYGALLYILCAAHEFEKDENLIRQISQVLLYLKSFQRENGSFPLMLNHLEPDMAHTPHSEDPAFAGWYPYNNYFDYLPFLGYFLHKASQHIGKTHILEKMDIVQEPYRDRDFIKVVKQNYQAVLSRPGGYWTNDIPIPLINCRGRRLTPCYGGEQFQNSIYGLKGLPLPYCMPLKKSLRWKSLSFFNNNTLWVISPLGILVRKYWFLEDKIKIQSRIYSVFPFKHLYLFHEGVQQISPSMLEHDLFYVRSNAVLTNEEDQFSADGRLKLFTSEKRNHNLILEIKKTW